MEKISGKRLKGIISGKYTSSNFKKFLKSDPFEAWTREKPGVDHLCVFGCVAYVPKEER